MNYIEQINKCKNENEIIDVLKTIEYNDENVAFISNPQGSLTSILKLIAKEQGFKIFKNSHIDLKEFGCKTVDVLLEYNGFKIVFEYDGKTFHSSDKAILKDKEKDKILLNNGYIVIHIREEGLPKLNDGSYEITCKNPNKFDKNLFNEIVSILNQNLNISIQTSFETFVENSFDESRSRDEVWYYKASLYLDYVTRNKTIHIPFNYISHNIHLGHWVQNQRVFIRTNKLEPIRKWVLEEIGFTTDEYLDTCEYGYKIAKEYYQKFGTINVPFETVYKDFNLGNWIYSQRQRYRHPEDPHLRPLSDKEKERLESLGITWIRIYHSKENLEVIKRLKEEGFDFNLKRVDSENSEYVRCVKFVQKVRSCSTEKYDDIKQVLTDLNISLDNDFVSRRTKLLEIRNRVRLEGYINWNTTEFERYKNFIRKECKLLLNNKDYPLELSNLIKGCGINPYAKVQFGKKDNELRKIAYSNGIPARIYYRYCLNKEKIKE